MLEIDTLTVSYGTHQAIQNLSLSVARSEVVAMVGPNGAGKTTLIRAVSGVVHPLAGTIRVFGEDWAHLSAPRRALNLAVVPQARRLPSHFTVWQVVFLGRTPHLGWLGRPRPADLEQVDHALERTHIRDLAERKIGELSGGEQQLVLLARALAQDAPILLLDEPTAHLDLNHQSSLLNLIRDLAHRGGLAVLMTLHDLNAVSLYADRVGLLVGGRLHALGRPAEVLTAENLSAAYNIQVNVVAHPTYGTPLILPDGQPIDPEPS